MELVEFWTICSSNGIILSKEQVFDLERYYNEMIYWNEKVNLVSRNDAEKFLEKHIMHSLTLLKYYEIPQRARMLDVGTGGGLPGIPLTIARPDIFTTLIDSISKKIKITKMFAQHTGIRSMKAVCGRAEDLALDKQLVGTFDLIVSRGVSKIGVVSSWVYKLLKPNGAIVFYKGGNLDEEIESAQDQFKKMYFNEIDIELLGAPWFKEDEKKLVICKFLR